MNFSIQCYISNNKKTYFNKIPIFGGSCSKPPGEKYGR